MDYPILLTPDGKYEAILNGAHNIVVEDELLTTSGGYETLTFIISNRDKKRNLLFNERKIQVAGREYIIRVIDDLKSDSNMCTVTCDATWYDLNDGELKYFMHTDKAGLDAEEAISQQLEGTDWTIGIVDVGGVRPRRTAENKETPLFNLRQIKGNFGGDLYFDTVNKTVNLRSNLGIKHQKIFCYEKNTTSIRRTVDTRNLFTRYTLIGKDSDGNDVTVDSINDGKNYVENYEWYDMMGLPRKLKWYVHTDDRWSNLENMLEHMNSWIDVYSKPVVGYELNLSMFEVSPNLGDYVFVLDKELGINGWLRVVSRKRNILQPHLSTVQLEASQKTIIDTIVSTATTSQDTHNAVATVVTPENTLKLPPGTENYVMQYTSGAWRASNVIGDINRILDALNGEVL